MANDSIRGRQVVLRLTNKSAGGVVAGDVVIISSGTASSFTTTTSAAQTADMVGVVLETIAQDATGRVCIMGYTPSVNLSASASLGDTIATHTVAKQAAPSASRGAGMFGEVLGTGTSPAALLWGFPDLGAGGGVATDTIWDAAGDIVYGTGANTGSRLAIGTAGKVLTVNAGATAPEWATAAGGGRTLLETLTPTGSNATFSSISGSYWKLTVEGVGRGDSSYTSSGTPSTLALNGDTTDGNYRLLAHIASGTDTQVVATGNVRALGYFANPYSAANVATTLTMEIINYAGTTFQKCAIGKIVTRIDSATELIVTDFVFHWENTAAVTSIAITLDSGSFVTGSTFKLYGES